MVKVVFLRSTVVDGSVMPSGTEAEIDEATAVALEQVGIAERIDGQPTRSNESDTETATSRPQRGRK